MGHRWAKGAVSRAFELLYSLAFVLLLAWAFLGYTQAAWGYKGLWSGAPRLNPFAVPLHNPLVLLESGVKGDQLVVRLLRTYAEPGAEDLLLVVELQTLEGEAVRMEVRRRVALGTWLSLEFPLTFNGEQLVSCKVEVYLSGRLAAVKEGC